jgi:hypothetical protein
MTYFAMPWRRTPGGPEKRLMHHMAGDTAIIPLVATRAISHFDVGSRAMTSGTCRDVVRILRTMTFVAVETTHFFLVSHSIFGNLLPLAVMTFLAIFQNQCCLNDRRSEQQKKNNLKDGYIKKTFQFIAPYQFIASVCNIHNFFSASNQRKIHLMIFTRSIKKGPAATAGPL